MTGLPLVSIVTPSLNQGDYIRDTVDSVLSQDYPNLAYWVMDGDSRDETADILAGYSRKPNFNWRSEPDSGQAAAIQAGWERSKGEIIAWLNADDLYRPRAISKIVAAFQKNPDVVLVYGRAALIDDEAALIGEINNPDLSLEDLLGLVHFLPQPSVFFRRSAYQKAGGLDTSLHFAFDFDLFLRLALVGPFLFLDEELAAYRWHRRAKTATDFYEMRREAAVVVRRFTRQHSSCFSTRTQQHFISYAHLVEGYACLRLGYRRRFVQHLLAGLKRSPANIQWVIRRTWKSIWKPRGKEFAYPYDPALF